MEMDVVPQPEAGALGVLGKLEMVGKCKMIVELLLVVLDQRVLHDIQEIVAGCAAIVLQRIEPARGNIGVPRESHAAAGGEVPRRPGAADKRCRVRRRAERRRPQQCTPRKLLTSHCVIPRTDAGWAFLDRAPRPAAYPRCESFAPNVSQLCNSVLSFRGAG